MRAGAYSFSAYLVMEIFDMRFCEHIDIVGKGTLCMGYNGSNMVVLKNCPSKMDVLYRKTISTLIIVTWNVIQKKLQVNEEQQQKADD